MDVLVSTHVCLERTQKRQLRLLAADRGLSMAALVREAVSLYLLVADGPSYERRCAIARAAAGALPAASRADAVAGPFSSWYGPDAGEPAAGDDGAWRSGPAGEGDD